MSNSNSKQSNILKKKTIKQTHFSAHRMFMQC